MTSAMAYDVDKPPAEWVSRQAHKRSQRLLIAAAVSFGTAAALLLLLVTQKWAALVPLELLIFAVYLFGRKAIDRKTDEAVNWIRGARAEEAIGQLLNGLRSESFIVMHDVEQAGEGNIDHIVSGPTGVFLIESKTRRYEERQLGKARRQAAKLHDELESWVTPVICIHERRGKPFKTKGVWIVPEPALLDWLRSQHERPVPFERLARFADRVR
jgi:hypothetical protein